MKKQIYIIASLLLIVSTTAFFIMTTKKETPQNPVQLTEATAQEEAEETDPQEEVTTGEEKNNSDASQTDSLSEPKPVPSKEAPPVPKTPAQEPKATAAPAPKTQVSAEKQKMLNLINSERAKVGAQPLAFDVKVVEVAQVKSADMVKNNYFSHTSPTYGSPFDMLRKFGVTFSGAAENIALNSSVEAAHAAFMASEGHRKNILNPSYNRIGIGITDGPQGKVFVQMFIQK